MQRVRNHVQISKLLLAELFVGLLKVHTAFIVSVVNSEVVYGNERVSTSCAGQPVLATYWAFNRIDTSPRHHVRYVT